MILVSNLKSSLCFQVRIVGLLDGRVRQGFAKVGVTVSD